MISKRTLRSKADLVALHDFLIEQRVDATIMANPVCQPKSYPCVIVVFRYDDSNSMRWAERCDFEYVYPNDFTEPA